MTRRLHVLLVPAYYPSPEQPVAGLFMRDLAQAISALNEVTVLAPPSIADDPEEVIDGIRTMRFARPVRQGRVETLQRLVQLSRTLSRLRRQGSPVDVLHAHYFATGAIAALVGSFHRIPVVVTENLSSHTTGQLSMYETRLARFTYRRAARVCPASPMMERLLRLLEPRGRYEVVPDVVDVNAFAASRRHSRDAPGTRILAVSNLIPRKGLGDLIEAVRLLVADGSHVSLAVVGEGTERGTLETRAQGLPVEFVGALPRAGIVELLRHADVFAMPTLGDPFGIAAVEALAAGVPVVVTSAAGSAELLQPLGAKVIRAGDSAALGIALAESLDNPNNISPDVAQELRDYCGPGAVGRRLDAIYRSVLGMAEPSRRVS